MSEKERLLAYEQTISELLNGIEAAIISARGFLKDIKTEWDPLKMYTWYAYWIATEQMILRFFTSIKVPLMKSHYLM